MSVRFLARALLLRWIAIPLASVCLVVTSASAAILTFEANLDGLQEVPPNGSPGFGLGDFTLDTTTSNITVTTGTYQDLLGGATAVTLNDAAIGFNGPIAVILTLDTPGAATGTFSGNGLLTPGQVADLLATNFYVNIRSQVYPNGEIRGQLFQVPEPSSIMLVGAGLAGLIVVRRRRK